MNTFGKWVLTFVAPFVACAALALFYMFLGWVICLRSDNGAPGVLGWGAKIMIWIHEVLLYYVMKVLQSAIFVATPAFIAPKAKKAVSIVFFIFLAIGNVYTVVTGYESLPWTEYLEIGLSVLGAVFGLMLAFNNEE